MSARRGDPPSPLSAVQTAIVSCNRCDRLRRYCQDVGRVKKAAFRDDDYWAKPVPGFGDPGARVLILGLAPAAHGANRTGRVFTGDGVGASGDFLMAALNRSGFANITTSQRVDDGLKLTDVYIAAAVRCAPPGNKPRPEEIDTCLDHLAAEVACLPRLEVVVALGKIAWDAWLKAWARQGLVIRPKPQFGHGAVVRAPELVQSSEFPPSRPKAATARPRRSSGDTFGAEAGRVKRLVGMYHPSRQNTNTGTVTPQMYDAVLRRVRDSLRSEDPEPRSTHQRR